MDLNDIRVPLSQCLRVEKVLSSHYTSLNIRHRSLTKTPSACQMRSHWLKIQASASICAIIGWSQWSSSCTRGGRQQGFFRFACDWLSAGVDVTTSPADRREKPVWSEELGRRRESEGGRDRGGIPEQRRAAQGGSGQPDTQSGPFFCLFLQV